MLNITIEPQPIQLDLDKANIEKYNEATGVLTLFKIETKEVKEDINDVSFTTTKSYDKKYEIRGFLAKPDSVELLQQLVSPHSEVTQVTITGTVVSNTEAKLVCTISDLSESAVN